ncbi:hypothetical protein [Tautonia rosea]|uniref:hypothetical protein n=1 Tax=Tautonia rosea TaxID=2728037 RepID=UPI00147604F3|nr:hypothetical protein [Tautonia rosea]
MPQSRWIIAIVALGVLVRVAAIFVLQSHTVPRSTYEHGEIAANLLEGQGFSIRFLGVEGPTSQQAPLYPILVAAAFAVGGVETPEALLLLQLGQAALGGVMVLAVMALAWQVAPDQPRMAIAAGLVTAVHPTLVYSATHVQVAGLAATLVTLAFVASYRLGRLARRFDAFALGGVLGLLVLCDPILGLITPAIAWVAVQGQGLRRAMVPLTTVALVALLTVTPWIIRNAHVHGEFVPVKSTFGYAFWQGNCSLSEGTDKVVRASVEPILAKSGSGLADRNRALWEARHEAGYIDDIALTRDDRQTLAGLTEPARSRWLFHRALDDLRAEPLRYPSLCAKRLRAFLLWDETNPKTRSLVYRAGHLGLTVLAVFGLIGLGPDLRRRLAPTLLAAALIATFHTLTIVSARFHVPVEPLMAVWASGMVAVRSVRRPDLDFTTALETVS